MILFKLLRRIHIKLTCIYITFFKKIFVFTDLFGFKFYLHPGDEISFYLSRGSITDAVNVINYILKNPQNNSIQIDLGCNMGAVSAAMWKTSLHGGKVYSVDADPLNAERCRDNLALNNYNSEHVTNAAIAPHNGQIKLRVYEGINGWQTVFGAEELNQSHKNYHISVPATTFANFIKTNAIDQIDRMKVDIEGMEYELLTQLHDILTKKAVKELIFELNELTLKPAGKTPADLLALWGQYDYTLYQIEIDGTTTKLKTGITPQQSCSDILAKAN